MCRQRGLFREARACCYRPLPCNVCGVSRPGPVRVQAVESRPCHHETSMSPFLPGPNRVGRPPGGEIYHLPPLKGYIDHYLTSCTGGGAHTDTHLYRYTYTHTDMCMPYDLAIPLLGIHSEETRIERDTCTPVFITALFIIVRTWKFKEVDYEV